MMSARLDVSNTAPSSQQQGGGGNCAVIPNANDSLSLLLVRVFGGKVRVVRRSVVNGIRGGSASMTTITMITMQTRSLCWGERVVEEVEGLLLLVLLGGESDEGGRGVDELIGGARGGVGVVDFWGFHVDSEMLKLAKRDFTIRCWPFCFSSNNDETFASASGANIRCCRWDFGWQRGGWVAI